MAWLKADDGRVRLVAASLQGVVVEVDLVTQSFVNVFELSGGDYYRSEFGVDCPGARRDEAFRYRTSLTQLCNNEILTFFDPQTGMDYGSCALGEFVPIGDRELFQDAD